MKIVQLKYGESVFGEENIFKGGRKDRLLPISFVIYLVQTENKNILVDVGCDDGAGFEMTHFKKPVEVLREYGVEPEEITDVIITHSHHDHIEAIKYYENALIHIQKDEYESGRKYIPEDFRCNIFEDGYSLQNEIKVKKIGGHTNGSCIVLIAGYVLCGDECYVEKNLTDGILSGVVTNEENHIKFIETYSDLKFNPLLFHDASIMKGKIGSSVVFES